MSLYCNRATALFKLKRYAESLPDAERAIELNSRCSKAYFRKAVSSAYLGHYLIFVGNACVARLLDPSTSANFKSIVQECFPKLIDLDSFHIIDIKARMGRNAVNTAMVDCSGVSHVVIIVEEGTYDCRPLTLVHSNTVIMGLGTINLVHCSHFPAIFANASSGYLFNVRIGKSESHAFLCQNSEFYLDRCSFYESKEAAIAADLSSKVYLRYVDIARCIGSGVLANRSAEVHIESSSITDGSRQALEVRGGARITAIGNTFSRNDKGVLCWKGAALLKLSRNIVSDCTSEGVLLSENTEAVIEDNKFIRAGSFSISLDFLANAHIHRNSISSAMAHGVYIKGQSNVVLHGNEITGCLCSAVRIGINYAGKVHLRGNNIHHNKGPGVDAEEFTRSDRVAAKKLRRGELEKFFQLPPGCDKVFTTAPVVDSDNTIESNSLSKLSYPLELHERAEPECGHCRATTEKMLRCSACLAALYCGTVCQRAAWALHKDVCLKTVSEFSVVIPRPAEVISLRPHPGTTPSASRKPANTSGKRFVVKAQARAGFAEGPAAHERRRLNGIGMPLHERCWYVLLYNESRDLVVETTKHKRLYEFVVTRGMSGHVGEDTKKLFLFAKVRTQTESLKGPGWNGGGHVWGKSGCAEELKDIQAGKGSLFGVWEWGQC